MQRLHEEILEWIVSFLGAWKMFHALLFKNVSQSAQRKREVNRVVFLNEGHYNDSPGIYLFLESGNKKIQN